MFVDIKEKIAIIQAYIYHHKGVEVDINLPQFQDLNNILKLETCYQIAIRWFQENNGKIELLK